MVHDPELVAIGKIAAPHGIRGQLRVIPYAGAASSIFTIDSVLVKGSAGSLETYRFAGVAAHGRKVILSLVGFGSINEVLHLVGRELFISRSQLPELTEDEYYWDDLLGLAVETEAGMLLGKLSDIFQTGSNDVYVVRGGEKEFLIPAIDDVVVAIDLEAGVMKVRPLEGLLDL